jgi:hypothetical protein
LFGTDKKISKIMVNLTIGPDSEHNKIKECLFPVDNLLVLVRPPGEYANMLRSGWI